MKAIRLGRAASRFAMAVALGMLVSPAGAADGQGGKPPKAGGALQEKAEAVDALLQSAWEGGGVKPSANASDAEYMRRAYVDILGRIPSVTEAVDFLSTKDPNKRAKLVDTLLEHPDYPKNFASIWAVTLVGRRDQGREVNRKALTDWLRGQFKDNVPWDKTAYSLITAAGSNRDNGACNFTLAHMEDGAVPLTSISMRVFMGQQVQCTQCHDHPSNDWKQADFWGVNAFYKGIRKETVKKIDATGAEVDDYTDLSEEPTGAYSTFEKRNAMVGIAFPRFLDGTTIPQGAEDGGEPVERRKRLAEMVTSPKNEQFSRALVNRVWAHFLGRGFVYPVDDFGTHNPPSNPELLDYLTAEFRDSKFDLKSLVRLVCASRAYNLTSMTTRTNDKDEILFSHQALKPMSPEQLFDSLLTATSAHKAAGGTGDPDKTRNEWLRQFQFTYATDEGEESTAYQGTIPQALMMMNGPLMDKAVSGQSGSFLVALLQSAGNKRDPAGFVVDRLYLAALGRHPSKGELNKAGHVYHANPDDEIGVLQDLFWALLNSNEFILNH